MCLPAALKQCTLPQCLRMAVCVVCRRTTLRMRCRLVSMLTCQQLLVPLWLHARCPSMAGAPMQYAALISYCAWIHQYQHLPILGHEPWAIRSKCLDVLPAMHLWCYHDAESHLIPAWQDALFWTSSHCLLCLQDTYLAHKVEPRQSMAPIAVPASAGKFEGGPLPGVSRKPKPTVMEV